MRLYRRLPGAGLYRSDDYSVYAFCLPSERHVVGKGGAVNRNEGAALQAARQVEPSGTQNQGILQSLAMLSLSLAMVWVREGLMEYMRV